ncbi:hypothetical protein MSG28_012862 [Choristoneura fumiferana]|uniref:Uncharacterized protein n=1 Tax=Choristoneura fumiferana TaxID=7141 RepID=A0ACC0JIH2_CHOFU|nr:hypothetical protein MSG28_012862 [Choristoneura fumiferana]
MPSSMVSVCVFACMRVCVRVFVRVCERVCVPCAVPNTDDARTVPLRYSYEENKQVAQRLQDIVKYYIMIKEFLANTSSAYSVTLCVYYGFHLVSDCVLLLECSTLTDPLVNAVYGLPWECMDNSNRRTVLILLQTVQQSLALKACNMVPVGVQTMQAVVTINNHHHHHHRKYKLRHGCTKKKEKETSAGNRTQVLSNPCCVL